MKKITTIIACLAVLVAITAVCPNLKGNLDNGQSTEFLRKRPGRA